jgi:short-subunit dehydrogenase
MTTALITGASDGIGLELAREFAAKGHNLILVARRLDRLNALRQELTTRGGIAIHCIGLDLSQAGAAVQLYRQVQEIGLTVDYLVNNAGAGDYGPFAESDWDKTASMIELNMTTLTHITHLFLPAMMARGGGRIMNVASTAAFQPGPRMAVYFATKAFVLHFSEALHHETHPKGVSVTALCPGPTRSGFEQAMVDKGQNSPGLFRNKQLPDSAAVARYAYRAMMRGQAVAIHGLLNHFLASTIGLFPRSLVVRISAALTRSN